MGLCFSTSHWVVAQGVGGASQRTGSGRSLNSLEGKDFSDLAGGASHKEEATDLGVSRAAEGDTKGEDITREREPRLVELIPRMTKVHSVDIQITVLLWWLSVDLA